MLKPLQQAQRDWEASTQDAHEEELAQAERQAAAFERAVARKVSMMRRMTIGDLLDEWDSVQVRLGNVAHLRHPAERERRINLDLNAVIEALAGATVEFERAQPGPVDDYDDDRR